MYVKSLKQLAIFAFAFNYDKLYSITDFDELSLQTRVSEKFFKSIQL